VFKFEFHEHNKSQFITFHAKRSQGEMYIGHGRLCVCLSLTAFPHYCKDPGVIWRNGRECPVVVHFY